MPTFPSYVGPPLPAQLNPLNPRHWLLLLDWIFFHPSYLKQYLYRADPNFYGQQGLAALSGGWQQPAYRALILTGLFIILVVPYTFWCLAVLAGAEADWSGVAFGVAFGVTFSVMLGMAFGVAVGVAAGVAGGVAVGVVGGVADGVAVGVVGGVAIGVTGGVAVGVAIGFVLGVAGGVAVSMAGGLAFGVTVSVAGGLALGVAGGAGALLGSLHISSSLYEFFGRILAQPWLSEFGVLPSPGGLVVRYNTQMLTAQPGLALAELRPFLRNPFRSHAAFRIFNDMLNTQASPLALLYSWLQAPQTSEFVAEPLDRRGFRHFPPVRWLVLGGVGNTFVDRSGGQIEVIERIAWNSAGWLYGSKAHHALVPLAQLLLALDQMADAPDEAQERLPTILQGVDTLAGLQGIPHSDEIIDSFLWLAWAYLITSLAEIAQLQPVLATLKSTFSAPLRPAVIELIAALADISREIVEYEQFTTPGAQGAALNRALGLLNEAAPQAEQINLPERTLLAAVLRHWQQLIAAEAGRVGERVLREMNMGGRLEPLTLEATGVSRQSSIWRRPAHPFANPYITGRPVTGANFVGRSDLLARIATRWQATQTPDSIILYGHRRMGKTSILQNLAGALPPASLLVYLDLKGAMALVEQVGDLLLALAEAIQAVAVKRWPTLPEPQPGDYQQAAIAGTHFQRLLRTVLDALPPGAFLVLALDEFEALEEAVRQKTLPVTVYNYLRMLSQQPQVTLVLAGLHTLDEMSRDYQQAFFNSYVNLPVSYLPPEDAERLITRPTPDFALNYERSVVDELYGCTHGQPLLLQSICDALVRHLNHELFDREVQREARIVASDLAAVLTDDFLRREIRYFDGVWRDQLADFPDQQALLHALARVEVAQTPAQLVGLTGLPLDKVSVALQALQRRDIVVAENDAWRLIMPLFQRWLRLTAAQPNQER